MIDIENIIFTVINDAIKEKYGAGTVTLSSEDLPVKATFPYVYITEADNYTKYETLDSSMRENHANVMYEVKVYTHNDGKRELAKAIFRLISDTFLRKGFLRKTTLKSTYNDGAIFCVLGRFEAVVSEKNITTWR